MGTYTPTPVGTLSNQQAAIATINQNLNDIADVLSDKLDRVAGVPNQMERDIDMNSNHIINVADPVADGDAVNLRTLRALSGGGGGGEGGGVTDHGLLTGLTDDDHPQYLTQGRGDSRYVRVSTLDASVASALGTTTLNALGDVVITSPVVGDVPKWDGTQWVNAPDAGGGGGGSTNLSFSRTGTTVTVVSDTGTDATLPAADTTNAGVLSAADKTKLNGIASGATVNSSDAALRDRATHTGTQTTSTISNFQEAVEDIIGTKVVAGSNVTVTYNDTTGTTTIAATGSGGGTTITQLNDIPDVAISSPPLSGPIHQVLAFDRTDISQDWFNLTLNSFDLADMGLYTDLDDDLVQMVGKVPTYDPAQLKWLAKFPNPVWTDVATGTLALDWSHRFKSIRLTNAGGCVVTVPSETTELRWPVGDAVWFYIDNASGGTLSLAAASGVTIEAPGGTTTFSDRRSIIRLVKRASNVWVIEPAGVGTGVPTAPTTIYNVRDYGALGNGTTNDTAAVQAALTAAAATGGTVYVPAGTYQVAGLTIASNVRLLGTGQGSVLRAVAGMGTTTAIIRNTNQGSFTDSNITIEAITFDGNGVGLGGSQSRLTELVSFSRITTLKVRGVTVTNTSYIGMACGGCVDVAITNSSFTSCGFNGTTANGGSSLWIASPPSSSDHPRFVTVSNCVFRNNRWHGLHFSVINGNVSGCTFENNQEAHIFGSTLAGVAELSNCAISGNTFRTVTQRDISGSAIELGGKDLVVSGNTILDCSHNGIALTDCQRVAITGNTIADFNKSITPQAAGVTILTTASSPNQPRQIAISGNLISDISTTGYAAVVISGSGAAVTGVHITNNGLNGAWTSGRAVFITPGKWGNNCFSSGNNGSQDQQPVAISWQPGTGTGNVSFTSLQFRPRRLTVKALSPSSTKLISSTSESNVLGTALTMNCQSFSAGTTGAHGGERGNQFYDLYDTDGTTSLGRASLVSFDENGFTINRTVTTAASTVLQILAYP